MTTTVTFTSATDSLTFYPTPDVNGWVYDNATLDAWYALPNIEAPLDKRPNAHGAYGLGKVYAEAAQPIVAGQFFGDTPTNALLARRRLSAFFSDGSPIVVEVVDELGSETRNAQIVDVDAPFRYGFTDFHFDVVLVAEDPRRYGPTIVDGPVGLPVASSGLFWNLGTAGSGLYFDWGTVDSLGQVTFTNDGGTETYPVITVGGAGSFDGGFYVTEIETGRALRYERATYPGEVVVFNNRTQRAKINDADVTGGLSRREWFAIPPGSTRRYQINSIGSTTGALAITLSAAPAEL